MANDGENQTISKHVLPEASEEIVLLNVSFKEKGDVKTLGALWNKDLKSWYVPETSALAPFEPWISEADAVKAMTTPAKATAKPEERELPALVHQQILKQEEILAKEGNGVLQKELECNQQKGWGA